MLSSRSISRGLPAKSNCAFRDVKQPVQQLKLSVQPAEKTVRKIRFGARPIIPQLCNVQFNTPQTKFYVCNDNDTLTRICPERRPAAWPVGLRQAGSFVGARTELKLLRRFPENVLRIREAQYEIQTRLLPIAGRKVNRKAS